MFRRDIGDDTVMVLDPVSDRVLPCSEASPVLRAIEYLNIHKLRYYADKEQAGSLKSELAKIIRG